MKNVILLLATIVIVILSLELGIRINEKIHKNPTTAQDHETANNSIIAITLYENTEWQVEVPMRNYRADKENTSLRILLLGDSVTQCNCPLVSVLQDNLSNSLPNLTYYSRDITLINVINAGKGGADTVALLEIFNKSISIVKPDVVTILSGWNDHWYGKINPCEKAGCYYGRDLANNLNHYGKNQFCQEGLKLCGIATNKVYEILRGQSIENCYNEFFKDPQKFVKLINHLNTSIYRVPIDEYYKNLATMVEISRSKGIKPILVTPPDALVPGELPFVSARDCTLLDKDNYFKIHHMYVDTIRQVANDLNVSLIDLDKAFGTDNRQEYFDDPYYDPIHPGSKGNVLCTKIFAERIIDTLKEDSNIKLKTIQHAESQEGITR
jgi:lysophospholipase L1-like esterase